LGFPIWIDVKPSENLRISDLPGATLTLSVETRLFCSFGTFGL
jgi:hypothetical protein